MLCPLQLEAVPDYPVAAGQRVDLHCPSFSTTFSVTWSWQRLQNETWTAVASGQDLTLTEPEQSGRYRCLARWGLSQERESTQHAVLIVSMPARGRYYSVLISLLHVNIHLGRSQQHLHNPEGRRTLIENDGWVDIWDIITYKTSCSSMSVFFKRKKKIMDRGEQLQYNAKQVHKPTELESCLFKFWSEDE